MYVINIISETYAVKSIRMYSIRARSMYQVQGKKYRIQLSPRRVYIELVLRRARKKTHTLKVACTVSRSKQRAAERERKDTCPYDTVYNSYNYAKKGIEMYNDRKSREGCYIGKNKGALVEVKSASWFCRIERLNHCDNKREECNRKVSRDYDIFAVLYKMEAKAEEGPEMDVDGAPPVGQNGKKCHHIVSCNDTMLLARMLTRNIVYRRIIIISYSHHLPIITLVYDVVQITHCVNDIKLLLFSLWLFLTYVLVLTLPCESYTTVDSIMEWFRFSWYRE
jgi:hypothetical protein